MDFLSFAKDVGVPIALVVFFVLEGKWRERRMADRLDKVEDFQRTELHKIAMDAIETTKENSLVMKETTSIITEMRGFMEGCRRDDEQRRWEERSERVERERSREERSRRA